MFERIYKVTRIHKVCRNSNLPGRNSHSRPVVGIPSMSSNWRPIILPGQESRPGSNSNLPGRNSKQEFENFLPGRNSNKGFAYMTAKPCNKKNATGRAGKGGKLPLREISYKN